MKPLVNLATDPFRNRRLFWLAILLLFLVPAYFGRQAIQTANRLGDDISKQDEKVRLAESQLKKVDKPSTSKVSVSPEENKHLVAATELIARRAFSWSQLLSDIERSIPAGVRVLRVAVAQIDSQERNGGFDGTDNTATLVMTVIGKSGQEVTTMIDRFHNSGRFKVSPISRKVIEGTEDIEFELKVEYFPKESGARAGNDQIAVAKPDDQIAAQTANRMEGKK